MISIPRETFKTVAYTASERLASPAAYYWFSITHAQTGEVTEFQAYRDAGSNDRSDLAVVLVAAPDAVDRTYDADASIPEGSYVVTTGDISVAAGKALAVRGALVTVGSTITGAVTADGGIVMTLPPGAVENSVQGLAWFADLKPGEYSYEISATRGGAPLESGMLFVDNYDGTSTEYDEKSQETKTVYYEPGT